MLEGIKQAVPESARTIDDPDVRRDHALGLGYVDRAMRRTVYYAKTSRFW